MGFFLGGDGMYMICVARTLAVELHRALRQRLEMVPYRADK